jgi:hypothetical protein
MPLVLFCGTGACNGAALKTDSQTWRLILQLLPTAARRLQEISQRMMSSDGPDGARVLGLRSNGKSSSLPKFRRQH